MEHCCLACVLVFCPWDEPVFEGDAGFEVRWDVMFRENACSSSLWTAFVVSTVDDNHSENK